MIKDQIDRIIYVNNIVDNIDDIPDPIEVGKLYFIKETGDIIGDLDSNKSEYGINFVPKWYVI